MNIDQERDNALLTKIQEVKEKFIDSSGTSLCILAQDGIVLAVFDKNAGCKEGKKKGGNIYKINERMGCSVIGNKADADKYVAKVKQTFSMYDNQDLVDCKSIPLAAPEITSSLGIYSQYSKTWRTAGASYRIQGLFMSWTELSGYDLFEHVYHVNMVDRVAPFKERFSCIGFNKDAVLAFLKREYDEKTSLEEAKVLTMKALIKNSIISADKIGNLKIATLKHNNNTKQNEFQFLSSENVKALLAACERDHEKPLS